MAEDLYREFKKEEQSTVTLNQIRAPLSPRTRMVVRGRFGVGKSAILIRTGLARKTDYSDFKLQAAVDEIKTEIRNQHHQTRTEVQTTRRDILDAIKASPAQCLKLACEFVWLFMLFCLAVRFLLNIELVNPVFAASMLFAVVLYWGMARLKQYTDKKKQQPRN